MTPGAPATGKARRRFQPASSIRNLRYFSICSTAEPIVWWPPFAVWVTRGGVVLLDERHRATYPTLAHAVLHVLVGHTAFHVGQLVAWARARQDERRLQP